MGDGEFHSEMSATSNILHPGISIEQINEINKMSKEELNNLLDSQENQKISW